MSTNKTPNRHKYESWAEFYDFLTDPNTDTLLRLETEGDRRFEIDSSQIKPAVDRDDTSHFISPTK